MSVNLHTCILNKYWDFDVIFQSIQYSNLPNIQTSLAVVNLLKLIDSGAIHFIGSLPFEAKIVQILQWDVNSLSILASIKLYEISVLHFPFFCRISNNRKKRQMWWAARALNYQFITLILYLYSNFVHPQPLTIQSRQVWHNHEMRPKHF